MTSQEEYARQLLEQAGVGSTEKMGKGNRLKVGKHQVALLNMGFVKNLKNNGIGPMRLQADFHVIQSTTYVSGAKASISFFIQRGNYPEYEVSRYQDMVEAIAGSLQDTRPQAQIGAECMTAKGRGVVLDVEITEDLDDEGQVQRGKSGQPFTAETWAPVSQTWDQVGETRADLDKIHGPWAPMGERKSAPSAGYLQPPPAAPQGVQQAVQPGPQPYQPAAPGAQWQQGPAPAAAPATTGSFLRRP